MLECIAGTIIHIKDYSFYFINIGFIFLNNFFCLVYNNFFVFPYCRHIIAAMHFNLNLQRDIKKKPDGSDQVKVIWPKFKNGEATVRDIRVKPDFG